ncbi:MAG TPA: hypothetical protein VFR43_10845 [Gaiellaceae bacterium]|nr:hypothetical protein [Gaiellaceae bacterium]
MEKHDDLRASLTANDPPTSEAVTSKTWSGLYRRAPLPAYCPSDLRARDGEPRRDRVRRGIAQMYADEGMELPTGS